MTTTTSLQAPEITEPGGKTWHRLAWILVLALLAAGAGVILWLLLSGGEGDPTVSFDGETATYSGPSTLQEGPAQITFENNSDGVARFAVTQLGEERKARTEQILTGNLSWLRSIVEPPGVADYWYAHAAPNTTEVVTTRLEPPAAELFVLNVPTNQLVLVATLEVKAN